MATLAKPGEGKKLVLGFSGGLDTHIVLNTCTKTWAMKSTVLSLIPADLPRMN